MTGIVDPGRLGDAGRRVWDHLVANHTADDELLQLFYVADAVDVIERLSAILNDEGWMMKGRENTRTLSAAVGERRQWMTRMEAGLKSLGYKVDLTPMSDAPMTASEAGRRGADARWSHRDRVA